MVLLSVCVCLVAAAAEPSPLVDYFSSDYWAFAFNPIHDAPAVLLLEAPLRADILARWRDLAPQTEAGLRMKGLLLEDAGDPVCAELLQRNEGDRIRLLWRAGKEEQARQIWQNFEGPRSQQAAAALLPLVATANEREISGLRDFLLESLSPDEVTNLCRDAGLPESMAGNIGVLREWNRKNPLIDPIAGDRYPDSLRLAMTLESRPLSIAEFGEVRRFLKSPDRDRQERIQVLEGLDYAMEFHRDTSEPVTSILLSDWMETHPDEVAEVLGEFIGRGIHRLARNSELPGILCLRRELKRKPDNRAAALCLAIALDGAGGRKDEIAKAWRIAADPGMDAPPVPGRGYSYAGLSTDTLDQLVLEFAVGSLPERYAEDWMDEWLAARSRTAEEVARMAAWLGLGKHFWTAWQEVSKNKGASRMLLECAAHGPVPKTRYDQRKAIDTAFADVQTEPWSQGIGGALGVGTVIFVEDSRGTAVIGSGTAETAQEFASLNIFRYLLANALAVGHPLRQERALPGYRLEEGGGIALHGFFASCPHNQGNGYFTPVIGNPQFPGRMMSGQATDPATLDRLLARLDHGRLSSKSARSLKVAKVASCSTMDERAIAGLRAELQEWWEQDRDPDVGRMLISYRMTKDRAGWPEWAELWREVAAAIPPHERRDYADSLASRIPPNERSAFYAVAGLEFENDRWMYPRMAAGEPDTGFPYLDMGKAEAFLGRNVMDAHWTVGQDEETLGKIGMAREEGFEAATALGADDSDLALSQLYTTAAGYHSRFTKSLLRSPRATSALAFGCYAELRARKDLEGARLCLDLICDKGDGRALSLLDDPWVLDVFGAAALEEWTHRVIDCPWLPEEEVSVHLSSIATRLSKAGSTEGAMGIAMDAPLFSPEGLALFLPGRKRLEFLAAWLTSKPEELRTSRRTTSFTERNWKTFPELAVGEWRELLQFLLSEDRWETHTATRGRDFPLLYALLSVGVTTAADALEQGQMDRDALADLLGRAAVQSFWKEALAHQIRMLSLDLAYSSRDEKVSDAVLRMLLKYSEEDPEITEAFRQCAKSLDDSPSDEVLKRTLKLGEIDAAVEMVKRVPEEKDPARVAISRSQLFARAGHGVEAWALIESQWPAVKKVGVSHPAYLRTLLPLARQAGDVEAVRELIALAPDPKTSEVVDSLKWLEERKAD